MIKNLFRICIMNFKFLIYYFSFMVFFVGNSFYRKLIGFGFKEGNDNV